MPDQPNKESLERAESLLTRIFIDFYSGRDAKEFRHAFRREVKPILAIEFDAIAKELRQQNAALVSALRSLRNEISGSMKWEHSLRDLLGNTNVACLKGRIAEADAALAPYAPAASGTEEKR